MPAFCNSRHVPFQPHDMFRLVADVESYPQFLPMCLDLRVLRRTPSPEGEIIIAAMTVGYKAIREQFTSRVALNPTIPAIRVDYIDGPFSSLVNNWGFRDDGQGGCHVDFDIEYEFKSRTLGLLMGAMFDTAFRRFSDAFVARAQEIYGTRAS
jgi:coenzyme Q-binding protein COQ10